MTSMHTIDTTRSSLRWATLVIALTLTLPLAAQEDPSGRLLDDDYWMLQTSLATRHFDPEPDHVNSQKLVNLEYQLRDGRVRGIAAFDNSYGQFSQYVYIGKIYPLERIHPRVYAKVTVGLIHGYKGEYEDKIPLNGLGIAPGIIPMLGYQGKIFNSEILLLGKAATLLTFGVRF